MFSKYEEQAKKVLVNMKQEMIGLKHPYIGSEHLLLSLLKYGEKSIKDKLKNHGITYDIFRNELIKIVGIGKESNDFYLYTPLLRNILETVNYNVEENNKEYATPSPSSKIPRSKSSHVAYSLLFSSWNFRRGRRCCY